MTSRLAAGLLVSVLIRAVEGDGGAGVVLAKGDATAGDILILLSDRGRPLRLLARRLAEDGYVWEATGPDESEARDAYIARRRRVDPDLWVIELDSPRAEAIVHDFGT